MQQTTTSPDAAAAELNLPEELEGAAVRRGRVSSKVSSPLVVQGELARPTFVANREQAYLHVAQVASFGIRGGAEVVVDPCPGSTLGEIEAYLYGAVTGLVLGQQGRFALHGTTVGVAGSTVAIAGRRGAGKTTTALALTQRGHELKGDDVLVLDPEPDGVRAVTTERPVHIGREAATALRVDLSAALSLGPRIEKLALPQPRRSPTRLTAVVVLLRRPIEAVRVRRLSGPSAFLAVHANAYRAELLRQLWRRELFAWGGRVAASVPVHVLVRPDGAMTHAAVADHIERLVLEGAIAVPGRG